MDPPLEVLPVPLERVLLNELVEGNCYRVAYDEDQDDVDSMDYLGHYMGMENHGPQDYDEGDSDGMQATYFSPRFQTDIADDLTTTFVESDDHDETHYFYEVPCPANPNNNAATIVNNRYESAEPVTNYGGYRKYKKSRKTRKSKKSRKSRKSKKNRKSRKSRR